MVSSGMAQAADDRRGEVRVTLLPMFDLSHTCMLMDK